MNRLAAATILYGASDLVLIHDAKDPTPQYEGVIRPTVAAFAASPPGEDESAIVVIHDRDSTETPDTVAGAGLALARAGVPTAVFIDELFDALKSRQALATGDSGPIAIIERKGRSLRASIAVGTQIPQSVPTVIFDLSETRVIFRTDSRSLSYLVDGMRLPDEMAAVIPRLDVGEFVISRLGFEWDRTIYGPR